MGTNESTITRNAVSPKLLAELNTKLFSLGSSLELVRGLDQRLEQVIDEIDPNEFVILSATATVCGTSAEDAYLSVEMIMKGHEMSPLFASFSIPGSTSKNGGSVNKDFSDVHRYVRQLISNFWGSVASTLTFKGEGKSIEESQK